MMVFFSRRSLQLEFRAVPGCMLVQCVMRWHLLKEPERLERPMPADSVCSAAKATGFSMPDAEPHRDRIPCLAIGLIFAVFEVINVLKGFLVLFSFLPRMVSWFKELYDQRRADLRPALMRKPDLLLIQFVLAHCEADCSHQSMFRVLPVLRSPQDLTLFA